MFFQNRNRTFAERIITSVLHKKRHESNTSFQGIFGNQITVSR